MHDDASDLELEVNLSGGSPADATVADSIRAEVRDAPMPS